MEPRRGLILSPADLSEAWVGRLKKSGLNTMGIHPAVGVDAAHWVRDLLATIPTEPFQRVRQALATAGIALEYELHAMSWLMPHILLGEHAEWFRMDEDGRRVADFNMCPSSEEGLAYLEGRAAELARLLPSADTHRYFFWVDDVRKKSCHCPRCGAYSPSDQALILYNHILRGVKRTDPEATHCYLAYMDTIAAPKRIQPDKGIFLEYAPIDRESGFAMGDVRCEANREQASHIAALLDVFGRDGSQALEYWWDLSRYYSWKLPYGEMPLYPGVLKRDVKFYVNHGFEHITSFACGLNEEYIRAYGEPPVRGYGALLTGR